MPAYDPDKNAQGFSPYDPDEKCRTLWHNVLVLDGDNFFPNVKDGIQAFLDQYDEFKKSSVALTTSSFETVGSLAPGLQLALTILVSGNDTLYSTMQYIDEVKADKELQDRYDQLEEQARQAGIQFIIDLVLTLLSFVPFGAVAAGAARVARAMVPIFRAARATRSLARGLEKALDVATDAKNIRAVDDLLSPVALEGRGRIGKALNKIQEYCMSCGESDYLGLLLDFESLGEALYDELDNSTLTRRSFDTNIVPDPGFLPSLEPISPPWSNKTDHEEHRYHQTSKCALTAKQKKNCIWDADFNAETLKSSSYIAQCYANSAAYPLEWVDDSDPNNVVTKTIEYAKCRPTPAGGSYKKLDPDYLKGSAKRAQEGLPSDPAKCQCDHMFEAIEVVKGLTGKVDELTDKEIEALCSATEYDDFLRSLKAELNAKANMRPLWNMPNIEKSSFIRPDVLQSTDPKDFKKWIAANADPDSVRYHELQIMNKFMENAASARTAVSEAMDAVVKGLSFSNSKAASALTKLELGPRDVNKVSVGPLKEANISNTNGMKRKLDVTGFKSTSTNSASVADNSPVRRSKRLKAAADAAAAGCSKVTPKTAKTSINKKK